MNEQELTSTISKIEDRLYQFLPDDLARDVMNIIYDEINSTNDDRCMNFDVQEINDILKNERYILYSKREKAIQ